MTAVLSAVIRKGGNRLRVYRNEADIGQGHPLYDYIVSIEELARYAAGEMYDVKRYERSNNVKIANWCRTAILCMELDPINEPERYSEDHDILVRNMYTQYGYAVEEYVNIEINNGALPPPWGYRISTQETHGGTRPDYVIRRNAGNAGNDALAWLDLTSSQSSGHIRKKAGTGWWRTPFVAELFYSPLNLDNISMAGNYSIAKRVHLSSAIRRQEMQQRLLIEYMARCTNKALGRLYDVLRRITDAPPHNVISTSQIARVFEEAFHYNLMHIYNHQQIVKGILVEYMTAPQNYYHATAIYIIYNFYSQIHSKKADAMRYVRESYVGNGMYITG